MAISVRTRLLLEGSIVPTLLRLALPNMTLTLVQVIVSIADGFFVGALGPSALAGVSLVFPLLMLTQTLSAGGIGGAVASAVARALGAGRHDDARALVGHAVVVGVVAGALFTSVVLGAGPALYGALGGRDDALQAAVTYSNVMFSGAVILWLFNLLASVARGSGHMAVPAAAMLGAGALQLGLSPALIHGLAGVPRLGVAGAALATLIAYVIGLAVLAAYLWSGRSPARPAWSDFRPRAPIMADVVRVGAPGCLNNVLTSVTVILITALVGPFGTQALAGYGMGARLEHLQIPIVFGFGGALIAMVGSNVGAGHHARARRIAWIGAAIAAGCSEAIGLAAALAPGAWMGLFTADPAVLEAGSWYLRTVGPVFGFHGLALALFFASQGAGCLTSPLLANGARLLVAGVGGWLATRGLGLGPDGVYAAIAVSHVCHGALLALAIHAGAWTRPHAGRP
jgi:putative MATE family efflux protein